MPRPRKRQPKVHARGWHDGSVVKAGNRWRAYRAPYTDAEGKRHRPSKTFDTEAEASAWATGEPVTDRVLLGQWLEHWYNLRSARLQPNTRATYTGLLNGCAPLSRLPLADLTEDDWQALTDSLLERWSREHVKVWKTIIGGALKSAVPKHLGYNPLALVKLPRAAERPPKAWRQDEVTRLLVAARGSHHEVWLVLALATGARIGELRALLWSDIDLTNLTMSINKSIVETTGNVGPTKSGRIRVVDLPPEVVRLLVAHKARQKPGTETLFYGHGGKPLASNAFRRWLTRMCNVAGVTPLTPHAARHTAASLALDAGVPIQDVARMLGHATPNTTMLLYASFLGSGLRRVASALGAAISEGVSGGVSGEMRAELRAQ